MRCLVAVAALALAACSASPNANSVQADVNAAAEQAQGDIDTYAANTLEDRRADASARNTHVAAPARPAAPPPVAATDDAAAATDVARTYFTLLEAGNYARAYRLWDGDGRASGMTERQFADSFARYARYRAELGETGRVEAGAGQRYVEIPASVTGTLSDDRRFALAGALILHRTVVDGASADRRAWRIRESTLRPRPERVAGVGSGNRRCAGETRVSARVDREDEAAPLWRRGDGRRVDADRDSIPTDRPAPPCVVAAD